MGVHHFDAGTITIEWQLQPLPYRDKTNRAAGFRVPDGYTVRHLAGRSTSCALRPARATG